MVYWQHIISHLENDTHDYKIHQLPLARIKKVMKADPEVKMISAEAPILFAKGCDIFITELTMRAWIHAEENKRRTLQRSDIASALSKSDMFDFLIDIVPREDATGHTKRAANQGCVNSATTPQASVGAAQNSMPQPARSHVQAGQHPMAAAEYGLTPHGMPPEQGFRPGPGMYVPPVVSDPNATYPAQQQMFENMYAYSAMPSQQVSSD